MGDGFGRLVALTLLGAVVPGSGLVAAGRRRTGWAVLAVLVAAVAVAVALTVSARGRVLALRQATSPDVLLGVAVGVGVLAAAWCAVIVVSHLALRRRGGPGTGGQRTVAVLLVAALVGLVALPAATASRYALSARSSLIDVFNAGGTTADRPGVATPDTEAADPWAREPRVNVMLLGSDHDAQHTGIRPDTLIVASIDTRSGDTVLISLPRNLQKAPFPPGSEGAKEWPEGFGSSTDGDHILNAVWGDWGEAHPEYYPDATDPGLAATASVVSTIVGMPIDYSVVVNLDGFQEIVDAMGGLRVDVPERLPIGGGKILGASGRVVGEYPVDGYVEPGKGQLLDGYHAVWFARSRSSTDDNSRINRQRCVLQDAVDQYGPAKVAAAFPAIADTANRNIETDVRADQIPAFVTLGKRVKAGNLTSLAFTQALVDTTDPDYPEMRRLVQQALLTSDGQAPPATPGAPSAGATTVPGSPGDDDPLAAPAGDPVVDTSSVCG